MQPYRGAGNSQYLGTGSSVERTSRLYLPIIATHTWHLSAHTGLIEKVCLGKLKQRCRHGALVHCCEIQLINVNEPGRPWPPAFCRVFVFCCCDIRVSSTPTQAIAIELLPATWQRTRWILSGTMLEGVVFSRWPGVNVVYSLVRGCKPHCFSSL